ncbi:MAG: hypothetical protein K0R66_872 [Gammaproteobacteria bacterium]|jgi:hypothetical protein|nr:hypothetical protein [Gammaproteobacteria bacterium]
MNLLQILSDLSGFIGTILVSIFGIAKYIDDAGTSYIIMEQIDHEKAKKIKIYKILSRIGLMFLVLSFGISLYQDFLPFLMKHKFFWC